MKKISSIILCAAMVLSMTACGGKSADPKAVYEEAVKKNNELTSMDMTSNMDMSMTSEGETVSQTMQMDIVMDQLNTDNMVYYAKTKTTQQGVEQEVNLFYTDGYYYIDTMGQKIKYPMDLAQIMEQVKQSTQGNTLDADSMKELSVKKDGDNQILTFTADPSKMDAYVKEAMGGLNGALDGVEDLSMTINSASGEYTINKDGYYTAMKMTMDYDMTAGGTTVNAAITMDATINNPGQPVTVTLPSTDGYQEVDPAMMQPAA